MGLGIPPVKLKIMLESNPLKSMLLVGGSAITYNLGLGCARGRSFLDSLGETIHIQTNGLYKITEQEKLDAWALYKIYKNKVSLYNV